MMIAVKKQFLAIALLLVVSRSAAAVPEWYSRIKGEDETGLVRACYKRGDVSPDDGDACSKKPKVCYFGTQECGGIGAHPITRCFCDGKAGTRKWSCEEEACLIDDSPVTTDVCPDDSPGVNVGCSADLECKYETRTNENGQICTFTNTCSCASGDSAFTCLPTIACVSANPPTWTDVCPDAPPGINVGCAADLECKYETSTTENGQDCTFTNTCSCTSGTSSFDCSTSAYCASVSANPPYVTDKCLESQPRPNGSCTVDLECEYEKPTTLPDGSPCTETTTCSCTAGVSTFDCQPTGIECVSANPPSQP